MYMSVSLFGSGGSRPARAIIAMGKEATKSRAKSQSDKFKELAYELEADEGEAHWDERLKKVTQPKPENPSGGNGD